MNFVDTVVYLDDEGNEHIPEDTNPLTADRARVTYTCPICNTQKTAELSAPIDTDERVLCETHDWDYFIRRPKCKNEDASMTDLINDQLESTSVAYPLIREKPIIALLLATRVWIALFTGLATTVGTAGAVYAVATLLGSGTIITSLGVGLLVLTAFIAWIGITPDAFGGFIEGYYHYRRLDTTAQSYTSFIKHVGQYYHEEAFNLG